MMAGQKRSANGAFSCVPPCGRKVSRDVVDSIFELPSGDRDKRIPPTGLCPIDDDTFLFDPRSPDDLIHKNLQLDLHGFFRCDGRTAQALGKFDAKCVVESVGELAACVVDRETDCGNDVRCSAGTR